MQEDAASEIDGFQLSPLHYLDPDDIESIEVKTSGVGKWGPRAAAGVVVITTKRAHSMATSIEANVGLGVSTPFSSYPMMGAADYKRYATDVMSGLDRTDISRLLFTNDDPTRQSYFDTHNATDWLSLINKTALRQQYGINVSGGDEIALYRFSLGYQKNDGNVSGTSMGRLNVRFNSDINLTPHLLLRADISYAQISSHVALSGLDNSYAPYSIALLKSPLYAPYQRSSSGELTNRLSDVDEINISNPLCVSGDALPTDHKQRFTVSLAPRYTFNKHFALGALLAFSWDKENQDAFMPDHGVADQPLVNDRGEVYATALNEVRNLTAHQSDLSADVRLDYNIIDNLRNSLSAFAGFRFDHSFYRYSAGRGFNTGSDFMKALSNTASALRWVDGFSFRDRNAAWYVQADYSFRKRYELSADVTMHTSSRYGLQASGLDLCGVRWMLAPEASARWNISAENFWKRFTHTSLAIHATWNRTGNDRLPLFAAQTYSTSQSFAQNISGNVLANIGNPAISPEITSRATVGADLSLFDHRWEIAARATLSQTTDLLLPHALPAEAGLESYWANGGTLKNRAYTLSTTARIIERRDWKLALSAGIAHVSNEITALPEGDITTDIDGARILTTVGQPAGVFYGFKTEGVFSTQAEADAAGLAIITSSGQRAAFAAGDVHFTDLNHDGVIDDSDRTIIGDPTPTAYGNFALKLQWRHLSIEPLFTFSIGGDVYNALRAELESGSTLSNQTSALLRRWTADGQTTDIPRATYGDPMGNARFSDRWIEDASYFSLRRLSISYDIPCSAALLQNIRIWAAAENVFTASHYLGSNPECASSAAVLYQGIDAATTPLSRAFTLGVKVNL